jgi:hypothetical protein
MKHACAAVLAAAGLAGSAAAGTVHGVLVRNTVTGVKPAANIVLTLNGTSGHRAIRSARVFTDMGGEFWFYDLPAGSYELEIWRNGHGVGQPEKCRVAVPAPTASIALPRPLRLQASRVKTRPELRNCSEGLEHIYS